MSRWQAFLQVCAHLRAGFLDGTAAPPAPAVPWELLIAASSHHNVTPALAWSLQSRSDLPAEIAQYLDAVLALNRARIETLLAALARIVAACNRIDIAPVLLKGAARLVDGSYPETSLRILGDLDVLIPRERASDVCDALAQISFRPAPGTAPAPADHHHLAMLHDRERGGGVELHLDVASPKSAAIIGTDWYLRGTRAHPFGDLEVRLADPTRSIAHIVAHDQLEHDGYQDRRLELRQLLDVALIRSHHEDAIDWPALARRFGDARRGKVLATYLALAEALLGQRAPALSHKPRPRALAACRHTIDATLAHHLGATSRGLTALLQAYGTDLRRDPARALRLFDARQWPNRIRLLWGTTTRKPPSW